MSDADYSRYRLRNPYYEALLREGTSTAPIGAHAQGMSRLAFALLSGLERNDLDQRERNAKAAMQLMGPDRKPGEQSPPMPRPL